MWRYSDGVADCSGTRSASQPASVSTRHAAKSDGSVESVIAAGSVASGRAARTLSVGCGRCCTRRGGGCQRQADRDCSRPRPTAAGARECERAEEPFGHISPDNESHRALLSAERTTDRPCRSLGPRCREYDQRESRDRDGIYPMPGPDLRATFSLTTSESVRQG